MYINMLLDCNFPSMNTHRSCGWRNREPPEKGPHRVYMWYICGTPHPPPPHPQTKSTYLDKVGGAQRLPQSVRIFCPSSQAILVLFSHPKSIPNRHQTDPRPIPNRPQTNPKPTPNRPQTDPKPTPNRPQADPQTDPRQTPHQL
jgi:hypothetical protein